MIKKSWSAAITLGITALLGLGLLVMCIIMPWAVNWYYAILRGDSALGTIVMTAFYACVPGAAVAIYNIVRLLGSIHNTNVFTVRNVTRLRAISWCCTYVAIITLVAGIFYFPLLIISFAACFFCLLVRVIKNVMAYAVDIKNENELTI